jgi:hypothetical protein
MPDPHLAGYLGSEDMFLMEPSPMCRSCTICAGHGAAFSINCFIEPIRAAGNTNAKSLPPV